MRKERLRKGKNLGISPKSLKFKKITKKNVQQPKSGKILGLKLLFEGASPLLTRASSRSDHVYTNLIAAQDKPQVVESCTAVDSSTAGENVIGQAAGDRQDQGSAADQWGASNTVDSYTAVDRYTAVRDMTIYTTRGGHHQHQGPHGTAAILGQSE